MTQINDNNEVFENALIDLICRVPMMSALDIYISLKNFCNLHDFNTLSEAVLFDLTLSPNMLINQYALKTLFINAIENGRNKLRLNLLIDRIPYLPVHTMPYAIKLLEIYHCYEAKPLLMKLVTISEYAPVRYTAIHALMKFDAIEAYTLISRYISDDDQHVRVYAQKAMQYLNSLQKA